MTYEAWRITYQDAEQAAMAAWNLLREVISQREMYAARAGEYLEDVCDLSEEVEDAEQRAAQAEREAVRECKKAAAIYCNVGSVVRFIRNRWPQHFKEME